MPPLLRPASFRAPASRWRAAAQVATVLLLLRGLPLPVRAQAPSPNILANPSFENSATDFAPWSCLTGQCGVDGPAVNHFAADGSQYAFLFGSAAISQKTAAVAGATYYLEFSAYVVNEAPSASNLQVSFGPGGPPAYNVDSSASTYITVANGTFAEGPYSTYSFNVTAQGNDNLTFAYFAGVPSTAATAQNVTSAIRLDALSLTMVGSPPAAVSDSSAGLSSREMALIAICAVLLLLAVGGWATAFVTRRRMARERERGREREPIIPLPLGSADPGLRASGADMIEKRDGASSSLSGAPLVRSYSSGVSFGTTTRPQTSSGGHGQLPGEVMEIVPDASQEAGWDPFARDRYSVYQSRR